MTNQPIQNENLIPEQPEEDVRAAPLFGKRKEPRKVSLAGAVFFALLLSVGTFLCAYVTMSAQTAAKLREMDGTYAKYAKMEALLKFIEENYIRDYDDALLWENVYGAMFDSIGDPYSTYMTAEEYAQYASDRTGNYVGIGISVAYDQATGGAFVHRVTTDSPAAKAGLQPGDVVTAVEDLVLTEETYSQGLDLVRGEEGTSVKLTILRDGESLQVDVVRGKMKTENVFYEKLEGNVAYIEIISFSEVVTYDQFASALGKAKEDGCTSYVFDLRNNPGGSLDVICKCLDLLLPEGDIVHIVSADGKSESKKSDGEHFLDAPMTVLCNGNTASAAELFTADLRDYGLATIVGETTFGKGTMQFISPLNDGSAVKITYRYYNPASNVSYEGIGIKPDEGCEVVLTEEELNNFYKMTHEEDRQLQKALEVLLGK
ncbi:MAG: S41 family peptidase [Ruminococcaceae bacterium]|nr:S41 family peptidase [Oscillospiraceae bacterium]MBQ8325338.1 S41 family peptidase [Clostridia bacterium]